MKVKGIKEDLNVVRCPKCGGLAPPMQFFMWDSDVYKGYREHHKKRMCEKCMKELKHQLMKARGGYRWN
jgi:NMD protein affecting ribosome stability and mRNA decay